MALGLLMSALDNTMTSAAISHIIGDINGFDKISWVFTAYMLASTSTMLVFGKLSDMFGRKLFYLIGISLFLIGSGTLWYSPGHNAADHISERFRG